MESIKLFFEWSATWIEVLGVVIIVLSTVFGTVRFVYQLLTRAEGAVKRIKVHMGTMLILILEFLVAADIIRTVAIDQTMSSVGMLGLLVLIRTFLSWSLTLEVEGRWPWSPEKPNSKAE